MSFEPGQSVRAADNQVNAWIYLRLENTQKKILKNKRNTSCLLLAKGHTEYSSVLARIGLNEIKDRNRLSI